MKQWKQWRQLSKYIAMLTQLGLTLVTPLLMCLFICHLLVNSGGVGSWIYIIGFFFGLGGSGMTAYKMYRIVTKNEKKSKDEKPPISFNRHK